MKTKVKVGQCYRSNFSDAQYTILEVEGSVVRFLYSSHSEDVRSEAKKCLVSDFESSIVNETVYLLNQDIWER